ncbi:MAG: hypothetical protein AAGF77_04660 [Bacteroidota bacterium]
MGLSTKIKAGALQFVLFVGVVIATLLVTFVLLTHTHLLFKKKTNKHLALIEQTELALGHHLGQGLRTQESAVQLPFSQGIETTVASEPWGVFEIYKVHSTFRKLNFNKAVLVGGQLPEDRPALYLEDDDRPLIIVGNAQIKGTSYLPEQGIRPGMIAGHSYYRSTLVQGRQKRSNRELPPLQAQVLQGIQALLQNGRLENSIVARDRSNTPNAKEITNSFFEPTQYITGTVVTLVGKKYQGNIIISATQKIVVDPSAMLNDVILVAPQIEILSGVKGNFQALATDYIHLNSHTELDYPSALVLVKKGPKKQNVGFDALADLFIAANAQIKGVVCYLDNDEKRPFNAQVTVAKGGRVIGQLYCEKALQLKGQVDGSVATGSFIAMESGSVYQNHLYQGRMDATMLHPTFAGLPFKDEPRKGICKWLY